MRGVAKTQFPHGVLAVWQICTHVHTHTLEGSELERDKRQMGEVGKGCCSNKLYQVKLRFNLMLPGYKTGSVTDNKCVA